MVLNLKVFVVLRVLSAYFIIWETYSGTRHGLSLRIKHRSGPKRCMTTKS